MSRRDYNALAAILSRRTLPTGLVDELADWLEADSPRFDRGRFTDASVPRASKLKPRTYAAVALDEQARKVAAA